MDTAVNSTTKELVSALFLKDNASYQFIKEEKWFADPNNIESYDKEKIKDIKTIEVRFREGSEAISKTGLKYFISPHFFIPNKTELGINVIPESKEHKLVKNWIYSLVKEKKLSFFYSTVSRPFDYDNEVNISELDVDYNKVGIECRVKNNRTQIADVIIPLKKIHELFGAGIVIEIQFSNQYEETTERRSYDWALKGYSICWIWKNKFDEISEDFITLKDKEKMFLEVNGKILQKNIEKDKNSLRELVQDFGRQIDLKMKELNRPTVIGECKVCGMGYMTLKKGKGGKNDWYGCSNWRSGCKHSWSIE